MSGSAFVRTPLDVISGMWNKLVKFHKYINIYILNDNNWQVWNCILYFGSNNLLLLSYDVASESVI